jgi:hypothetical protein|tara:strand:+ start:9353 stop:9526 length:174 start_codon:yes stop_codon:yes gene_type:complete
MTSAGFVYLSIPVLYCYREYGSSSMTANVLLMMLAGVLVRIALIFPKSDTHRLPTND